MCKIDNCDLNSSEVRDLNVYGKLWLPNMKFLRYCHTNALMHAYLVDALMSKFEVSMVNNSKVTGQKLEKS